MGPSSSETDDIWKTQPSQSSTAATVSQAPPPSIPAKAPVDDLDDDFEGLEDAKEGSADDDFATISRSGLDDFNAVFDSSPPPSQTKSDGSTAGAFGVESSFDFVSHASTAGSVVAASSSTPAPAPATSSSTPTATPAAPVATSSPPAATSTAAPATTTTQPAAGDPDPNDWDAIFASLDAPLEGGNGGAPVPESLKDLVPQPSAPAAAADNRPPTLGRALTEEGVHDDPILKTLVAMGYSRSQALMALERYDYDLDRVSISQTCCAISSELQVWSSSANMASFSGRKLSC